jgi:transposase
MGMAAAVEIRKDYGPEALRQLAAKAKDANEARRLLALAAVCEGRSREDAARIGGMDRQTLRDWVHAFNERGPEGLINGKAPGPQPKLSAEQKEELAGIAETGPDPEKDGIVRWRCAGLKHLIKERWDIELSEVSFGRILKELGFSHISPRPRHPKQEKDVMEAFKKTSTPAWARH